MIEDIFCRKCKNCGREITILHPRQWAYKRAHGSGYYWYWCSWKCLRETERKEENMEQKLSKEQKKKAIEIAISGGNPLEYMRECGSDAPGKLWYAIKAQLKKNDPETYAKIPARLQPVKAQKIEVPEGTLADAVAGMTDAADTFFGACKDMGLKLETPEKSSTEMKLKPGLRGLNSSDFIVSAIKHPALGEFYYDKKYGKVDWRTPEGEEVSMSPKAWEDLYMLIPDVMGILQVEVDHDQNHS